MIHKHITTQHSIDFLYAVCEIGSEKYPDDRIECDYDCDNHDQAFYEIENFYDLHSETNLLNLFISLQKFRTSYNFFNVFDLTKQKPPIASQPIRSEFQFSAAFGVADYVAHALVLTLKPISISSEGQRHFDLL